MSARPLPPAFQRLAWLCALAVVAGFFLPWAVLDFKTTAFEREIAASARRSLGKTFRLGGGEPSWIKHKPAAAIPTRVSGFQVPILANRKNIKVVTSLVELVTKQRDNIGLKSYAVYLLPGLALLCAWLLSLQGGRPPVALLVALVCAGVAGGGFFKLLTTDTKRLFAVAIGPGLWLSLWAYAGLAAATAAGCVMRPRRRA